MYASEYVGQWILWPPTRDRIAASGSTCVTFGLSFIVCDWIRWRIVYAVSEEERVVDVLAVRKRPPYDYGDMEALISEIE